MSKDRPYEYVPSYALAYLIEEYQRLVNSGMFKLQPDLDKMKEELESRFTIDEQTRHK